MGITSSSSNQKRCEGAASRSIYPGRFANLGSITRGGSLRGHAKREVFDYLDHRREVESCVPSTLNQAVVALRMFYRDYLGRKWALWERFVRCRSCSRARRPGGYWVAYEAGGLARCWRSSTIAGLRVGEAVGLRPGHIDAQRGVVPHRGG